MGWHMKLVICVQLAYVSVCLTREMSVVHEWTSLDVLSWGYELESRRSILPSQVKSWFLYKDRLFVTLHGEPYSLAYFQLTDNSTSPLLRPYPSYENRQNIIPLINPDKIRVDRCDRLWVMTLLGDSNYMIVIDLKTDSILRHIFNPVGTYSHDMTVDDFDCDNEYVYISNAEGVWTYSWAEEDSWHQISDPIYSMILAPNSIVYYNLESEPIVYYMSTTHLRDKSNKTSDITELGRSRKLNVNLTSSALDAKSDVLYYFNYDNKTVIHAVPCCTSERCSSNCRDVSIDPTHELRYITVDENGYPWAVTSRSSFDDGQINFRLLSVPVKSTCVKSNDKDTTNTSTVVETNTKYIITNTSTGVESNAKDTTNTSTGVESNAKDTTNTSTGVESNAKDTTNTSTDVEPNAKDTTDTTNINESTTPASSTTEQTSTLGSVPQHTTVNVADTKAGKPNSNITQAVGGTNMPYLLFSIANVTFNLTIVTVINFPNNHFH